MQQSVGTLAGAALLLCGILVLRRCWARRPANGAVLAAGGWLVLLAGMTAFVMTWNGVLGTAYGLLAASVLAYGVVGTGLEVRTARRRASGETYLASARALEPEERRTNWLRGTAKAFLAIILAGFTAIGLGLGFAVGMPLETHDRILIGGLLVPILWGAGMAWTLCDARLVRAAIVLLSASAFGYGIAFLPKMLG